MENCPSIRSSDVNISPHNLQNGTPRRKLRRKKAGLHHDKRLGSKTSRKVFSNDNTDGVEGSSVDFLRVGHGMKKNAKLLRPRFVPCAPQNSTQYIIDEHLRLSPYGDCRSCDDFNGQIEYSPVPHPSSHGASSEENMDVELASPSCSSDIDENQETFNYMVNDFNNVFQQAHEERFAIMSREELIERILKLKDKMIDLESR